MRLSAIAAVAVTMEKKSRPQAIARSSLSRATIAAVGDRKYLKIGRQAKLLLNDLPAAADISKAAAAIQAHRENENYLARLKFASLCLWLRFYGSASAGSQRQLRRLPPSNQQ